MSFLPTQTHTHERIYHDIVLLCYLNCNVCDHLQMVPCFFYVHLLKTHVCIRTRYCIHSIRNTCSIRSLWARNWGGSRWCNAVTCVSQWIEFFFPFTWVYFDQLIWLNCVFLPYFWISLLSQILNCMALCWDVMGFYGQNWVYQL